MSLEAWLAFSIASAVLVIIPGPTVLLVVSYALGQGWRSALPTAVGVALGDFTAMTLSMLGLGAILQASATLYLILKWLGAVYLIWLGIRLWRSGATVNITPKLATTNQSTMLMHAWFVTALNPKSLTFFIAFLPQFMDQANDFWIQMIIFEITFLSLAFANALFYALTASHARSLIGSPRIIRLFNRTGGALLAGAGLTLLWQSHLLFD
jgi:threonine/homoserine/homoserine lactone efflux protein